MVGTAEPDRTLRLHATWAYGSSINSLLFKAQYFYQITQDPFVVQDCVLLVLLLDLVLPGNHPLPINTNCVLWIPGGPSLAQLGGPLWNTYYSTDTTPFLVDLSDNPYPQFKFQSLHRQTNLPSVFSLLVNANSKLQNIKDHTNTPTLLSYIMTTEATVKAIFHVTKEVQVLDPPFKPATPDDHPQQEPADMDLGYQDEADHFGEPDYNEEEDDKAETIHGFTFPEVRTVIQ